jgi:dTDP-glucose 4,6-dehydratase
MDHPLTDDLNHILRRGADLWDDLRGARLFITGGTGFFGKWLLESLAWANRHRGLGAQAVVLTRRLDAFRTEAPHLANDAGIHFHDGDLRTFAFPPGRFTHVIHAATPSDVLPSQDDPELMLDIIVNGMRRVLEFARHASVSRLLFTSSGAVYGRQPASLRHVDEDFPGAPDTFDVRWTYAIGKRTAEHLCAIACERHGLAVTIARGFAFVGPYLPLDAHFAIGNFLRDGLAGSPIRVAGDGTPFRSYLYAGDLAVWLWKILLRGTPARAYNVGSEHDLSIAQLAEKVAAYFGTTVQIAKAPEPGRLPERYVPATARAREELGLETWIGLDEAIERTVRWHRGRP